MFNKYIHYDKLFPRRNGVNLNELLIDVESMSYITTPYDSNKITNFIAEYMENIFNMNKNDIVIVDTTACIGGDTIMFCNTFKIVIPIEINQIRYNYLINNLKVYDIKNAYPILGNANKVIYDITQPIHVIYIDPPWGGKDYKSVDKLDINFDNEELYVIVQNYFTIKTLKMIALKLPKNYDLDKFKKTIGDSYEIILYDVLKKINLIIITKKN